MRRLKGTDIPCELNRWARGTSVEEFVDESSQRAGNRKSAALSTVIRRYLRLFGGPLEQPETAASSEGASNGSHSLIRPLKLRSCDAAQLFIWLPRYSLKSSPRTTWNMYKHCTDCQHGDAGVEHTSELPVVLHFERFLSWVCVSGRQVFSGSPYCDAQCPIRQ